MPLQQRERLRLAAIGASTGGPSALRTILTSLPADFDVPIIVVQHLVEIFGEGFIQWLGCDLDLKVREAAPRTRMRAGGVYVGVRGPHVGVTPSGEICAVVDAASDWHKPAISVLFESVASAFGPAGAGVLLTGMGSDGAKGLKAIAQAGGLTVAQDEASCVVFGMPAAAIEMGAAQHIVRKDEIADFLITAVRRTRLPPRRGARRA